ncbi:MAG: hypothetical protein JKY20_11285 [Alphaproteobacteria bacterium]|nr:hypothetical protein [Alphaproteobacteria bacterium]
MRHAPQDNAMTEIALALAMGFFSIMVLTLISFGAPAVERSRQMEAVTVMPTKGQASGAATKTSWEDLIVIVDAGRYLGANMKELPPSVINAHVGRVVLAIDPAMPLQRVIEVRGKLTARDLVIVNLNDAWRAALSTNKEGVR